MAHKKKPPPGGTDGGSGNNKAAKLDESRDNKADGQSSSGSYEASPLKRERATRAEMIERQDALYDIVLGNAADDGSPSVLSGEGASSG